MRWLTTLGETRSRRAASEKLSLSTAWVKARMFSSTASVPWSKTRSSAPACRTGAFCLAHPRTAPAIRKGRLTWNPILHEFGSVLLRWAHIIAAMAWVGASFYFMHLDAALRPAPDIPPDKGGEAWEVHGGGFYQVKKYLVAPSHLPEHLMWHKWESYTTWITGVLLLIWTYYYQAPCFLIDPGVMALTPLSAFLIGIGGIAFSWIVYDLVCRSPLGKSAVTVGVIVFILVVGMAYFFQHVFSARGAFIHTAR